MVIKTLSVLVIFRFMYVWYIKYTSYIKIKTSARDFQYILQSVSPVKHTSFSGKLVLYFSPNQKATIFEILEFHFCFMQKSHFLIFNLEYLKRSVTKRFQKYGN